MTLRPSVITPESMKNLRPRKGVQQPVKKMVIDCKHDSHWQAIHDPNVNGVVLRRRPIRAIETFFDRANEDVFTAKEIICSQSRLRTELQKHLVLESEEDEVRRTFLINDIASWMRVLTAQTRSREYKLSFCSELPTDFQADHGALKMIITYRATEITFRQPKDKDERSFSPYGVAVFRGNGYESPVEWRAQTTASNAFYLTLEPFSKKLAR